MEEDFTLAYFVLSLCSRNLSLPPSSPIPGMWGLSVNTVLGWRARKSDLWPWPPHSTSTLGSHHASLQLPSWSWSSTQPSALSVLNCHLQLPALSTVTLPRAASAPKNIQHKSNLLFPQAPSGYQSHGHCTKQTFPFLPPRYKVSFLNCGGYHPLSMAQFSFPAKLALKLNSVIHEYYED
jgi:hypothetical protein